MQDFLAYNLTLSDAINNIFSETSGVLYRQVMCKVKMHFHKSKDRKL